LYASSEKIFIEKLVCWLVKALKSSEPKYITAQAFFFKIAFSIFLQLSSTLLFFKILIRIVVVEPVEIVENF